MNVYELLSIKILPEEITESIYNQREAGIFHTPYKDEIRLFSCIKQGDLNRLIKEMKPLTANGIFVGKMSGDNIMQYRYMAVSCITLATRYAIQGGLDEMQAYNFSDDFIRNVDTLTDANHILGYVSQKIIELTNLVNASYGKAIYSPHIKKCVEYINKNLHKKITVTELADECCLSPDYISHLFKKETGENLSRYILKQKLETAKTLLWEGFDSCKICYTLNFCSQSYFISAFKREFNMTPKEYIASIK